MDKRKTLEARRKKFETFRVLLNRNLFVLSLEVQGLESLGYFGYILRMLGSGNLRLKTRHLRLITR